MFLDVLLRCVFMCVCVLRIETCSRMDVPQNQGVFACTQMRSQDQRYGCALGTELRSCMCSCVP